MLIYQNHYVLINKLHINLRNHNCSYISRSCLSSYSSQNVSLKQKERCEQQKTTSIRNSNESHLFWKKHFSKNLSYFMIIADFQADDEIANSSIRNKNTNIFTQNPVNNGCYIVSVLDNVLRSGYYESPPGYENVYWFTDEVIRFENKVAFFIENTNKDIIMSEKEEEGYGNNSLFQFCEKKNNI